VPAVNAALLLGLGAPVWAADVVLYDAADPTDAVTRVAEAIGQPAGELTPRRLSEHLSEIPPQVLGGDPMSACLDAVDANLRAILAQAEGAFNYQRTDEARALLADGADAIGCLDGLANPPHAGRLFFLRGVVLHDEGDLHGAHQAFHQALMFQPEMMWDTDIAPRYGRDVFDTARAQVQRDAPALLRIAPAPRWGTLTIDGWATGAGDPHVELPPGRHLIQITMEERTSSAWLDLAAETRPTLLIPALATDDMLDWISDAERRPDLALLISAAGGTGTLYLAGDEQLWSAPAGSTSWAALEDQTRAVRPAAPRGASRILSWSGAITLGGGLALGTFGYLRGHAGLTACEEARGVEAATACGADAEARFEQARRLELTGGATAALGGALTSVGLVLTRRQ